MSKVNDVVGELSPAFPQHAETGNMEFWRHGMTLRDYFAGIVLGALILKYKEEEDTTGLPEYAYDVADSMLKVRNGWGVPDAESEV